MKKLIIYISVLFFPFFLVSQTEEEMKMIIEINKIRKDPKSYIPVVESYIKKQELFIKVFSSSKNLTGRVITETYKIDSNNNHNLIDTSVSSDFLSTFRINIYEAKKLIKELETTKPMDTLVFNPDMYQITVLHANYLKSINKIGHFGPNGELLHQRFKSVGNVSENVSPSGLVDGFDPLFLLMLDFGVPGYGHRKNILEPEVNYISISINEHCVVQNFML